MTIYEFREALKRGLGRCNIALKTEDKEIFRDIVQWGCLHVNTCNTQEDGFLDEYIYRLVACYDAPTSFLPPVLERMMASDHEYDTDEVRYLIKLATHFAVDGSLAAKRALRKLYLRMFAVMSDPDRVVDWMVDLDMEVYATIAIALMRFEGEKGMERIARNVGSLILRRGYESADFEWIFSDVYYHGSLLLASLSKVSGRNVDAFFRGYGEFLADQADIDDYDPLKIYPKDVTARIYPRGIVPFSEEEDYDFDSDDEYEYVQSDLPAEMSIARAEKDDLVRYLSDEKNKDMPFDELVGYLSSYSAGVRQAAQDIFVERRDAEAIAYARKRIATRGAEYFTFTLLLRNYQDDMKDLLMASLQELDPEFGKGDWHGIILSMIYAEEDGGYCPTELLHWAFDHSLCRSCRENVMHILYYRGELKEIYKKECHYDANHCIATFAATHDFPRYDFGS